MHMSDALLSPTVGLTMCAVSAGALAVYLAENGAQQLILGHLSRENNTPRAALETVSLALAAAGFQPGTQPELYAAPAEMTLALTAGKACVCCR